MQMSKMHLKSSNKKTHLTSHVFWDVMLSSLLFPITSWVREEQ